MAYFPQKTYSKREKEVSLIHGKEKENVDPFDELLSSPLKQEVQFQPLSFWGPKVSHSESKGKFRRADFGLFEASDSDELNSPFKSKHKRKRKPVAKYSESKARTVQSKNLSYKFSNKRKNYSCIALSKHHSINTQHKDKPLMSVEEFEKDFSLGSALNKTVRKVLDSSWNNVELCKTNKNIEAVKSSFKHEFTLSDDSYSLSLKNKRKNLNYNHDTTYIKPSNLIFKIYEDGVIPKKESDGVDIKSTITTSEKDFVDGSLSFDKSQEKSIVEVQSGQNNFNFVSKRRYVNYPNYMTMCSDSINDFQTSGNSEKTKIITSLFLMDPKKNISNYSMFKNIEGSPEFSDEIECKTLTNFCSSATDASLPNNESLNETLCPESSVSFASGEFSEMSMLECQRESTIFDVDLLSFNDKELEELILELHNANAIDGVGISSSSDDTLSSFNDEDTIIKVKQKSEARDLSLTGSARENDDNHFHSQVSRLATQISDLSLLNKTTGELAESETVKTENFHHDFTIEDTEKKNEPEFILKNIAMKKRGVLSSRNNKNAYNRLSCISRKNNRSEKETDTEMEFNHSISTSGRTSLEWNKTICFANPVFESTRVFDTSATDIEKQVSLSQKFETILKDSSPWFEQTYILKPGKKWVRSMSVLRQIQNGSIVGGGFESTRITGRKFGSFVQDMLEIQNEKSEFFTTLDDLTDINKMMKDESLNSIHFPDLTGHRSLLVCENSTEQKNSIDFNSSTKIFENTVLEKSSFGHTIKVIEPEEKPSAFRSAMGVNISHQSLSIDDSYEEKSSSVSARDFILMQCGQNDVLPFEDYFNKKTLPNCRKIGEGVYGEVFMCSNSVIKIIPIEGSDKVNGEPQKTFEEIISEVIIAAKLSSLRKGEKHRTEGFSEMKRCWCVQGKYPKYLLQLWKEYDQLGNGSENDSPVMFKEDQLYIILELSNGGKDLESFVFSSCAQSLSIFIQGAYSLAAAEKAFEFEHRDLHWGNILISETKEKFTDVCIDGNEYKIPTKGVKICIIDFTLSRIHHEGCCIFNDLSVDPGLFASEGDYQFEIYRLMLKEVKNDWSLFKPKTNLFWLHYTLDKMIKMVRYKNKKTKIHVKHMKDLKTIEAIVLEYKDSAEFVSSGILNDVIRKL